MMRFKGLLLTAALLLLLAAAAVADGYPESSHPYPSNSDQTWEYTFPSGVEYVKVTFSANCKTEEYFDRLYVTDGTGETLTLDGAFGGTECFFKGPKLTFKLTSDDSAEFYGFAIQSIQPLTYAEYNVPRFTISNGVITGVSGEADNLNVPATIDGQTVTAIGGDVFSGSGFKTVTLPASLTQIGYYAFNDCPNLTEVTFLADEVSLSFGAFNGCPKLERINGNIRSFDSWFDECPKLASVSFADGMTELPDWMYFYSANTVITLGTKCGVLDTVRERGYSYVIRETGETNVFTSTATTVAKKVQDVVAAVVRPGMSDYQKALALHNWLMFNANYDQTYSHYSPDGVLLDGTGVCQSYATAYQLLLNAVGIENDLEYGDDHVWNMIVLDGEWYHVDVTWDDPIFNGNAGGGENWGYFGLSNYALTDVRSHECYEQNHIATAYRYNYAYRHGELDDYISWLRTHIQSHLDAGEQDFSIPCDEFAYDGIAFRTAILIVRDDAFTVNGSAVSLSIDCALDEKNNEGNVYVTVEGGGSPIIERLDPDFRLPAYLVTIEERAFEGIAATAIEVSGNTTTIGSRAFADCGALQQVTLPASVNYIANDAFDGCGELICFGYPGTVAEGFAYDHGWTFINLEAF